MNKKYYYDELFTKLGLKYEPYMINLVESPCGSGKSYHCNRIIREYDNTKNVYYVTDTRMLKETMERDLPQNVSVITYNALGMILDNTNSYNNFIKNTHAIFLDEIHQLFRYANKFNTDDIDDSEKQYYRIAMAKLYDIPRYMDVIALSATPSPFINHAKENNETRIINRVLDKNQIKMLNRQNVDNHNYCIKMFDYLDEHFKLDDNKKAIIYGTTIKEIKSYQLLLESKGYSCGVLWSKNNQEIPMSDKQLELYEYVKNNSMMPHDIDVLIINGAYESGWNLENNGSNLIQSVYVNTSDYITITQVQNRIRHDIELLVTPTPVINRLDYGNYNWVESHTNYVNKQLSDLCEQVLINKQMKSNLCGRLGFVNDKRNPLSHLKKINEVLDQLNTAYNWHDYRLTFDEDSKAILPWSIDDYINNYMIDKKHFIKYYIDLKENHYINGKDFKNTWTIKKYDELQTRKTKSEITYLMIQHLKLQGFTQKQVSAKLELSLSTVKRYWK